MYQSPSPLRLTSRGRVLLFLVPLTAILLALVTSINSLASVLAGSLAVVSLLFYWRLLGVARSGAVSRLRVSRIIEGELIEGRPVKVRIRVENPTPMMLEHVEVYDFPPSLWDVRGQPRGVVMLPPFSSVELVYEAIPVYGLHRFEPTRLIVYDPLGIYYYTLEEPATATSVKVRPRAISVPRGSFLIPSSPRPGGAASGRRRGVGTVFYDVREYVPGDDLRFVDWKGYARSRRLYVKQFEQEVQVNTILVFDATPTMFVGARGETKAENTARVVRSVLEYVASRGDNYMLVVIEPSGALRHTPWLRGRSRLGLALDLLSSLEWPQVVPEQVGEGVSGETSVSKTGALLGEYGESGGYQNAYVRASRITSIARLAGREKSLIFLFTDVYESPIIASIYADALEKLRGLKHEVQTLIPLTLYFEVQLLGDSLEVSLYALMSLETLREYVKILRAFRRKGIPVVATGPVRLVENVLQQLEWYRRLVS